MPESAVLHSTSDTGPAVSESTESQVPAVLLFVDCGNPASEEVAQTVAQSTEQPAAIVTASALLRSGPRAARFLDGLGVHRSQAPSTLSGIAAVVFAPMPFCRRGENNLQDVTERLLRETVEKIVFVHSIAAHFHDPQSLELEEHLHRRCAESNVSSQVLRTGFLCGNESKRRWKRAAAFRHLVSSNIRSTFVTISELSAAVHRVALSDDSGAASNATLLGTNRSWAEVLADYLTGRPMQRLIDSICRVPGALGGRMLTVWLLMLWIRGRTGRRMYNFRTISPRSQSELLSLCNPENLRHIVICGHNNGINHFGWRFPGRTAIPTTDSGQQIDIQSDSVLVDAGITLKRCADALDEADKQLPVMPNFSYIGVGTAFFVPIHGSGSAVSTLGDAIEWVRMFDCCEQRVVEASRNEPLFRQAMYDRNGDRVLLQLRIRIQKKTSYCVRNEVLHSPNSAEVWNIFADPDASNIEVRKKRGASDDIDVARYYEAASDTRSQLDAPQDAIGRVWDRIEENRLLAWLFHWFVRTFGYHVELFLRREEFDIFWRHHSSLELSKIQLRFVKKDGMPNSPFSYENCVSADLFMSRKRREGFHKFLREHLPDVQCNPGKQSLQE